MAQLFCFGLPSAVRISASALGRPLKCLQVTFKVFRSSLQNAAGPEENVSPCHSIFYAGFFQKK
jgi:hypothetical protein